MLAALPAVETLALVGARLHSSLSSFHPVYNDEVHFWHEVATARVAGLGGGYYTIDEHPAAFAWTHFGPHGPFFPLLLAGLSALGGWHLDSAPILNLLFLASALAAAGIVALDTWASTAAAAAGIATMWPLLLLVPTYMQESLHQAIGIGLAAGLVVLARAPGRRPRLAIALGVGAVLASFLRPTWALLLPPIAVLGFRLGPRPAVVATAACGALALLVLAVFDGLAASVPTSFTAQLLHSGPGAAHLFAHHARENLGRLLSLQVDDPLQVALRYQVLLGGVMAPLALMAARRRLDRELAVVLWFGGTLLAVVVLVYDTGSYKDYRTLAPVLGAVLILLAASRYRLAVVPIVLINAAVAGVFLGSYSDLRSPNFAPAQADRTRFAAAARHMTFRPGADPWCNTLLTDVYPPVLVEVPPGFGISTLTDPAHVGSGVRSGYVLLGAPGSDRLAARIRLSPLATTDWGTLYRNPAAGCP